ncbi:hypothetical protein LVQ78_01045 [Buttiauxella sp. A2-C2_NF]|uniref:hypothetical protein n=1 Tax=Buttiauxella ferragutiae TaxID=82989 RepID=UPI001E49751E|nr:hypothetical protein [Buttiauxella ferragutiae]
MGQYISSDPIGFAGGLRPQGYVHNPLEWVDPLGLVALDDKGWSLYHIMKGDDVVYVGITKDVRTGTIQHTNSGRLGRGYELVEVE